MLVPRYWAKADGSAIDPKGKRYRFQVWGWSHEDAAHALASARDRLSTVVSRVSRGEDLTAYAYGRQPLREEIVRTLGEPGTAGEAVVTRNRYGALVLNTAQVPFIDVDAPRVGGFARLLRRFGGGGGGDATLERIREACRRSAGHGFRIYRTRAGYRVLATDLRLDPRAESTHAFLAGFAADPFFIKLCGFQGSFRARLTPKPWRCGCALPPGRYPREDAGVERAFAEWLAHYDSVGGGFATCRYLETVGPESPPPETRALVEEHDRVCRADSDLALA